MSLKRHAIYAAAAALAGAGGRFLILMLMARLFPQAQVGQFAYALFLVDISFLLVSFGMNAVASRYLAEYAADPERRAGFFVWWHRRSLWVPPAAGGAVLLAAMASELDLSPAAAVAFAFWAMAYAGQALVLSAFVGLQRFDQVFAVTALGAAASLIAVLLAAWAVLPLEGLYALMGAACIASVLLPMRHFSPLWRAGLQVGVTPALWSGIASYSLNMWLTALLWALVWSRGELPVVRHWLGDVALANYSIALSLMAGLMTAVMLGSASFAAQVTRLWGEGRKPEAHALCRKVAEWQLVIAVCGASAAILFGPEVMGVTFGEAYSSSVPILAVLACGLPALAFIMQNHLLQLETNARYTRNCAIAGAFFLLFGASVLTAHYGVEGAALSRISTMTLMALANILFLVAIDAKASIPKNNALLFTMAPSALLILDMQAQSLPSRLATFIIVAALVWGIAASNNRVRS